MNAWPWFTHTSLQNPFAGACGCACGHPHHTWHPHPQGGYTMQAPNGTVSFAPAPTTPSAPSGGPSMVFPTAPASPSGGRPGFGTASDPRGAAGFADNVSYGGAGAPRGPVVHGYPRFAGMPTDDPSFGALPYPCGAYLRRRR